MKEADTRLTTAQPAMNTAIAKTRRHHDGGEYEVSRHPQRSDSICKNERCEDVERRLLGHAQQGREDDPTRLFLDDFDDRSPLDLVVVEKLLENRSLQDAEPDPQA